MKSHKKIYKIIFAISLLLLGSAMLNSQAMSIDDDRQFVQVSPDIKDKFLTQMREDLTHLNDILSAITDGDLAEVVRIAERRMGLANKRIERMVQNGASDKEISLFIARIRKMVETEGVNLPNRLHGKRRGKGLGQFMPEELRAMGQEMHKTAYHLADVARDANNPPNAEDYKKLFSAINDITTQCKGCHDAFRVR